MNDRKRSLTADAVICDLNVVSSSPIITPDRILERIKIEAAISTSVTLQDLFAIRMLATSVVIVDSAFMTLSCKIRILTCKVSILTVADSRWYNVDGEAFVTPDVLPVNLVIVHKTYRNCVSWCMVNIQCLIDPVLVYCLWFFAVSLKSSTTSYIQVKYFSKITPVSRRRWRQHYLIHIQYVNETTQHNHNGLKHSPIVYVTQTIILKRRPFSRMSCCFIFCLVQCCSCTSVKWQRNLRQNGCNSACVSDISEIFGSLFKPLV